jgi:hypothetical protein
MGCFAAEDFGVEVEGVRTAWRSHAASLPGARGDEWLVGYRDPVRRYVEECG